MNYREFKAYAGGRIKKALPEKFMDDEIRFEKVMKVNKVREVLLIWHDGKAPGIYLDDWYSEYLSATCSPTGHRRKRGGEPEGGFPNWRPERRNEGATS